MALKPRGRSHLPTKTGAPALGASKKRAPKRGVHGAAVRTAHGHADHV